MIDSGSLLIVEILPEMAAYAALTPYLPFGGSEGVGDILELAFIR